MSAVRITRLGPGDIAPASDREGGGRTTEPDPEDVVTADYLRNRKRILRGLFASVRARKERDNGTATD